MLPPKCKTCNYKHTRELDGICDECKAAAYEEFIAALTTIAEWSVGEFPDTSNGEWNKEAAEAEAFLGVRELARDTLANVWDRVVERWIDYGA